jgi:hypothetical protein
MNQPWLTTIDCPVSALDPKPARKPAKRRSGTASILIPQRDQSFQL